MTILKILGSLSLAIFLIAALALILIVSTSLESIFGTPFAQRFFYQAGWFDVLLGLLAVNMICAAVLRYPFKRKHTGFITTHIGIVLLLAGSLLTRLYGIEGQMMLYEGEKKTEIAGSFFELVAHKHPEETYRIPLRSNKIGKSSLVSFKNGASLTLHRVWDNAIPSVELKEGPADAPVNPAIQIALQSQTVGLSENVWLVKQHPFSPHGSRAQMGPAQLELKDSKPAFQEKLPELLEPTLFVKGQQLKGPVTIAAAHTHETQIALESTGYRLTGLQYYPDARVAENHKLVSVSENPSNPAVEFDLLSPDGTKQHHVLFAFFPEFASIHGKEEGPAADFTFTFMAPGADHAGRPGSPSLIFYTDKDQWFYASSSKKGAQGGRIEEGKTYTTGWMDFSFEVKNLFSRAIVTKKVTKAKEGKGLLAVEFSLKKNSGEVHKDWVIENETKTITDGDSELILAIAQKTFDAPFELELSDFRKVDYPGTRNASSYESDVILRDAKEKITIQKTIRMNKPLDYKGFRIFQSSFVQDPENGEASVFTVAKNPGIWLIYSGSVILFLGIVMVFFIKPLSSLDR